MTTVTYKNQPGIHQTRGAIPLAGTSHLYTVTRVLWPSDVEDVLQSLLIPRSLHVCAGHSKLGDVRIDLDPATHPDMLVDAKDLKTTFAENSYQTVLCDPPYNGRMQWNHDLLTGLSWVASERIIFQHWFLPATKAGLYKKAQEKFALSQVYVWQGRTYFGRAQIISVFDRIQGNTPSGQ